MNPWFMDARVVRVRSKTSNQLTPSNIKIYLNSRPSYPPNWKSGTTDQKKAENQGHFPKIRDTARARCISELEIKKVHILSNWPSYCQLKLCKCLLKGQTNWNINRFSIMHSTDTFFQICCKQDTALNSCNHFGLFLLA